MSTNANSIEVSTDAQLTDFEDDEPTCPSGEPLWFCNPDDDRLGCFGCFEA